MTSATSTSRVPSNMDWLEHKPIIAKLYIDDDFQMPQLITHMEQVYNFKATKNMYKKRLLAWDLRKNYRRSEKEAVLAQMEEHGQDAIRDLQVHGKPILLGRVKRFEREEKNSRMAVPVRLLTEDVWAVDLQASRATKRRRKTKVPTNSVNTPISSPVNVPPRIHESPGHLIRSDSRSEYILHLVCTIYDDALLREFNWHQKYQPSSLAVTQRNTSRDTRSGWPPAAFIDFSIALHHISARHYPEGFWYVNRACKEIMSSLSESKENRLVEFHSMADVIDLFCDSTWDAFPELRRQLLMYLMRLSAMKEGRKHPLTMLWTEFLDRRTLVDCRDVLQRRLNCGFERRIGMWKIRLKCQWPAREPQQLFYGHSQWRWDGEVVE